MKDLIGRLASAIATSEGFFAPGETLPKKNHNPGDLRAAPGHSFEPNGFVGFSCDEEGIAALMHQVALNITRGQSLKALISVWAPVSDGNNTTNYINETARRLGFSTEQIEQPLWSFLEIEHIP
jgi:hypothetical protein